MALEGLTHARTRYRYIYAVFAGSKWGITNNKRKALRTANKTHGTVYAMTSREYGTGGWDAPTFQACANLIHDARN